MSTTTTKKNNFIPGEGLRKNGGIKHVHRVLYSQTQQPDRDIEDKPLYSSLYSAIVGPVVGVMDEATT